MIELRVTTHSGDDEIINVESYNAKEINDMRNDNEVQSILLGDHSYSKIDIKNIKPVED